MTGLLRLIFEIAIKNNKIEHTPPQGLSEARRGKMVFQDFIHPVLKLFERSNFVKKQIDPPRGRPTGGGRRSSL
jgi:hypothetical protein